MVCVSRRVPNIVRGGSLGERLGEMGALSSVNRTGRLGPGSGASVCDSNQRPAAVGSGRDKGGQPVSGADGNIGDERPQSGATPTAPDDCRCSLFPAAVPERCRCISGTNTRIVSRRDGRACRPGAHPIRAHPVPGTVEIASEHEIDTSAAVPGTDMGSIEARIAADTAALQRPPGGSEKPGTRNHRRCSAAYGVRVRVGGLEASSSTA